VGVDRTQFGGKDRAAHCREPGADGEGFQLGGHEVDPHGLGDVLVLAHGHPRPAETRVPQPPGDEADQQAARQDQVVQRLGAAELEAEDFGPGDLADALGAAQPGSQPVRQHQDADDLAEAQGGDGQVVAAHLEHGRADQHPGDNPHHDGKRQRLPEVQAEEAQFRRGQDGHRVGADGEVGHVAQVEHAGEADDDVEAHAEHDVEADDGQYLAQEQA